MLLSEAYSWRKGNWDCLYSMVTVIVGKKLLWNWVLISHLQVLIFKIVFLTGLLLFSLSVVTIVQSFVFVCLGFFILVVQQLFENVCYLLKMILSCLLVSNDFALLLLLEEGNPSWPSSLFCIPQWHICVHSSANTVDV